MTLLMKIARRFQFAVGSLLVILLLFEATVYPALAQGGQDGQGLEVVGGIGGAAGAVAMLPDGGMLLAEGAALLRLDAEAAPVARLALRRGNVQEVALWDDTAYVLTEQGLATVDAASMNELAFVRGGGQALIVTGQAIYVAAQKAGIRVAPLGEPGHLRDWLVLETPDAAIDLAVSADARYLYAAMGAEGIGIYDLRNALMPDPVGLISDIGQISTVQVSGDRLLAGDGHRLRVFDLSTSPVAPTLLDLYDPLHDARDVLLRHQWAYVADAAGGVKRYSVADLYAPRLDQVVWPGTAYGLAGDTRYLYVAAGWDGVVTLDVGRPDTVSERSRVALPGKALAITTSSGGQSRWSLVGMAEQGVAVIDWRRLDEPRLASTLDLGGTVHDVALRDSLGFAAVEDVGLVIFSVSVLEAPRVLATVAVGGQAQSLAVEGSLVYVAAGQGGLVVVETIRPAAPEVLGMMLPQRPDQPFKHVALEGGKRAYLSTGGTVVIADVDVPDSPQILAAVEAPARAAVARNFVVYAVDGSALTNILVASSNEPGILAAYRAAHRISDIAAQGNQVWLAGQGPGAALVSLEGATSGMLRETSTFGESGGALRVAQARERALLATQAGAVLRFDADGTSAVLRQGIAGGDTLRELDGGQILVGGADWGSLRLGDGAQPVVMDGGDAPPTVFGLAQIDGSVFFAAGQEGVVAVGKQAGQWLPGAFDGAAVDVAADARGFVYVAERGPEATGRLRVLDLLTMETVTTVELPGPAGHLALRDLCAYVTFASPDGGGAACVDVSAPTGGLHRVASLSLAGQAMTLSADNWLAYVVDGRQMTVLDLSLWPETRVAWQVEVPQSLTRLVTLGEGRLVGLYPGRHALLLSLENPLVPTAVATLPEDVLDLAGDEGLVYLARGELGLAALNLDSLSHMDSRMQQIDEQAASVVWLGENGLYTAGAGSVRAFELNGAGQPVLRGTMLLPEEGWQVTRLLGRDTRRDGTWLYLASGGRVLVVHERPSGELVYEGMLDGVTVAELLAVHEGRLYVRGATRVLTIVDVSDADSSRPTHTFPLMQGVPLDVLAWENSVLVATQAGLAGLAWTKGTHALPAVQRSISGLPAPPDELQVLPDGTVWMAGRGGVWRAAVTEQDQYAWETVLPVEEAPRGFAVMDDGSRFAVASSTCGLRVYDAETAQEVAYWHGSPVSDVAALEDMFVAAGDEGIILLREPASKHPMLPPTPTAPEVVPLASEPGGLVNLRWNAAADPCQTVSYTVYLGATEDTLDAVATTMDIEVSVEGLPQERTVFWQVEAVDGQGDRARGPVWTFHTGVELTVAPQVSDGGVERISARQATSTPEPSLLADTGFDASELVPLLALGLAIEVLLVLGLVWRWRRRRRGW